MIIDKDLRSQFSLVVFSNDTAESIGIRNNLSLAGYEVFGFNDQETTLNRIIEAAPHILIFPLKSLSSTLTQFVESVNSRNSETLMLVIGEPEQAPSIMEYRNYNVAAFVGIGPAFESRLIWEVDNLCEGLTRLYQNEQLFENVSDLENQIKLLNEKKHVGLGQVAHILSEPISMVIPEKSQDIDRDQFGVDTKSPTAGLSMNLLDVSSSFDQMTNKEEIVDLFFEQLRKLNSIHNGDVKGIFFRFLPTVNSFVATHALGMDIESLRGIGGKLAASEIVGLDMILKSGQLPQSLVDLVAGPLKGRNPISRPLFILGEVEGIVVLWPDNESATISFESEIEGNFFVFAAKYQLHHLAKRVESLNIEDALTGLFNRDTFYRKCEEEVARARRLKNAVSIIKINIDNCLQIEKQMGSGFVESILRTISAMVRRTSRVNDIPCRTGEFEVSIVLPHCARKGAAVRAERIRRMIEGHEFLLKDKRVTASLGISEYPTLCKSASDLDKSAMDALKFISSKGGNKVCLFKPAEGFRPDYDVVPV